MKQELDNKLFTQFPRIFSGRNLPPTESLMCFGFECSDGWYNILLCACYEIQNHIDHVNTTRERLLENNPHNITIPDEVPQLVAMQVKEKFGTLSFYYSGGDDYCAGVINMAEQMSGKTCEVCGNTGSRRGGGWIQTLCEEHSDGRE